MQRSVRVGLFVGPAELISIALPLLFIVGSAVFLATGVDKSPAHNTMPYLILAIFGSGHTILTYVFLSLTQEGRQLSMDHYKQSKKLVALALTIAILLVLYFLFSKDRPDSILIQLGKVLLLGLFAQHALRQILGLSLLYNRRIEVASESDRIRARALETTERRLFALMCVTWIVQIYAFTYANNRLLPYTTCVLTALVVWIWHVSRNYPHAHRSNKSLFLLRLCLFPLALHSPFALLGIFVVHGVEYYQLIFGMLRKSSAAGAWRIMGAAAIVSAVIYPAFHFAPIFESQFPASLIFALLATTGIIDHFHYFADGVIFRFSNPAVRRNLQHLVSADRLNETPEFRITVGSPHLGIQEIVSGRNQEAAKT